MSPLVASFIVLSQSSGPVAWVIAPHVADMQAKAMSSVWRTGFADATVKAASDDSAVETYDANGRQETFIRGDAKSRYMSHPSSVQAARLAPNADVNFVVSAQQVLAALGVQSSQSWMRVIQRLGVDKVQDLVGGVTLAAPDRVLIDGLAGLPVPRSGFVEALGPPVDAVIPANVPTDVMNVGCVSVRPSAVFAQAVMGLAVGAPMEQTLFLTHLRGLESQLGKRFADDALGSAPRVWTVYRRGAEVVGILEVADTALVKRFLASYAEALTALLPGTRVDPSSIAGHDAITITLPSRASFAIAYDKSAVIVGTTSQALKTHFAGKLRSSKSAKSGGAAIAFGTGEDVTQQIVPDAYSSHHDTAVWSIALTDAGFRLTGDVHAKK